MGAAVHYCTGTVTHLELGWTGTASPQIRQSQSIDGAFGSVFPSSNSTRRSMCFSWASHTCMIYACFRLPVLTVSGGVWECKKARVCLFVCLFVAIVRCSQPACGHTRNTRLRRGDGGREGADRATQYSVTLYGFVRVWWSLVVRSGCFSIFEHLNAQYGPGEVPSV
jgi:hypothetical protein